MRRRLGTDPASGRYRAAEADAALRLQARVGPLHRATTGDADWIDESGRTYDAVGPVPAPFFNVDSFNASIDAHLRKQGVNFIVVDLTGLSSGQRAAVQTHIDRLAEKGRVLVQG